MVHFILYFTCRVKLLSKIKLTWSNNQSICTPRMIERSKSMMHKFCIFSYLFKDEKMKWNEKINCSMIVIVKLCELMEVIPSTIKFNHFRNYMVKLHRLGECIGRSGLRHWKPFNKDAYFLSVLSNTASDPKLQLLWCCCSTVFTFNISQYWK